MKSYLEFKTKVNALQEVEETVKAIEKIAASQIYGLKKKNNLLKAYSREIALMLHYILPSISNTKNRLFMKNENIQKKLLIIISGEKGLAGAYYNKLFEYFVKQKENYDDFVIIGERRKEFIGLKNIHLLNSFIKIPKEDLEVKKVLNTISSFYLDKKYKQIDILFSSFQSLIVQEPKIITYLPFSKSIKNQFLQKEEVQLALPIFEPSMKGIFKVLIDKFINIYFYQIILEARLSELCARAVAMEKASHESQKIIKNTIHYFLRERRKELTKAQIEEFFAHKVLDYGK